MKYFKRAMTDDKKLLVQETIDRLLYCDKYDEKLREFNQNFNSHDKVKYTIKNGSNFKFPIDKAI